MTTDITELAQREKFEAWAEERCALPWGYLKNRRTNTGYFSKHDYTSLWAAWKAAGAELVEALEHYKSREERVTNLVHDNSKSWNALYQQVEAKDKRNAELVEALESETRICATWRKTAEANSEKLEKAQHEARVDWEAAASLNVENQELKRRIAELESRTVTVKMPRPGFITISGERMAVYLKGDVDAAMLAAGIEEAE
ncbi:TPA: ead/Ea22-like family protein [Klebsiella michiganensis]